MFRIVFAVGVLSTMACEVGSTDREQSVTASEFAGIELEAQNGLPALTVAFRTEPPNGDPAMAEVTAMATIMRRALGQCADEFETWNGPMESTLPIADGQFVLPLIANEGLLGCFESALGEEPAPANTQALTLIVARKLI